MNAIPEPQELPHEIPDEVAASLFAPGGAVDNAEALVFYYEVGAIVKAQNRFTRKQNYTRIKGRISSGRDNKYWPTYYVKYIRDHAKNCVNLQAGVE